MWKFLHWTLTIMKEIMHKQLFTDVLQENLFWKVLKRHTQFVQNATFQLWKKNDTGCLLNFYKKNPLIFSGFSKDTLNEIEFYTTEIKQKSEHFVQQCKCYNQSNWTYKFNESCKVKKTFFFFSKILQMHFLLSYYISVSSGSSTIFFFSPAVFREKFPWATRACMLPFRIC